MSLTRYRHSGGWCILPVHYSLDADKDVAWMAQERGKFLTQGDWDREMELDMRSIAGTAAYPHWADGIHIVGELPILPGIPLCLACDFNVAPMVWLVCQLFRRNVRVVDEVVGRGVSVPDLVTELRNRYPTHTAELWIYGDPAGSNRNAQTAMSDYDLMRLGLRGYPVPVVWKVAVAHPLVKDRVAAVNHALRDTDGRAWVHVHQRCGMLIQDMQEVVLEPGGGLHKVNDRHNPYHQRTHASDALGYLIAREFPVAIAAIAQAREVRKPLQYGRILGKI